MVASDSPQLLFDIPNGSPKPTGNPWAVTPAKPASVPVPLPIVMVRVEGSYTALDRKLWLLLLHNAWDDLDKPMHIHEASISEVLRLFRQFGRRDLGQRGVIERSRQSTEHGEAAAIWQSVRRLVKTTVDWEDEEYQGISALLASAMTNKSQRESGRIYYTFSPQLAKNVLLPRAFARLRTHFIMGLRSKYAVTLYEILEGYANRREPVCVVSMDDLRQWLKVPDSAAYGVWRAFRRRVIEPAINEINKHGDDAGFSVAYEAIREGKAYTKIKFTVTKTDGRQERDAALGQKAKVYKRRARAIAGLADPENPPNPSGDALDAFRRKWPGNDPYEVIGRFHDKWRAEGCAVLRKPDGAFLKFAEGMFKARAQKGRASA
ncbi:MAG: replication initiation protein [Beijerinckiaceae bacterium]